MDPVKETARLISDAYPNFIRLTADQVVWAKVHRSTLRPLPSLRSFLVRGSFDPDPAIRAKHADPFEEDRKRREHLDAVIQGNEPHLAASAPAAQAKPTQNRPAKRLRSGDAALKILAALRSLADRGEWNVSESEIIVRSGVSKSTYYSVLANDDEVKLALEEFKARRLGRGPERKDSY
jgi:hypothetical protein